MQFSFISVFNKCIQLLLFFYLQNKDGENSSAQSTLVQVGKWKVPLSENYLDLFRGLLDCDQLKVRHLSRCWTILPTRKKKQKKQQRLFVLSSSSAGFRFPGWRFSKSELCSCLAEPPLIRRAGQIHSQNRGETWLVRAEAEHRRGGEARLLTSLCVTPKKGESSLRLNLRNPFEPIILCVIISLFPRLQMPQRTSCLLLTLQLIWFLIRSKTLQPSSTWWSSAGDVNTKNTFFFSFVSHVIWLFDLFVWFPSSAVSCCGPNTWSISSPGCIP